jgi:hypothetical protein
MNIGTFPLSIDSGVAVLTLDRPFCLDIAGQARAVRDIHISARSTKFAL